MNIPMISIIVPVYNVEKYIRQCLNSILAQSYKNFELILVDDGSMDSSGKICDQYGKIDDRITVIHSENRGLSAARNTALDIVNNEYIALIDSDDCINVNYLEILMGNLLKYNADLVMCKAKRFINDDEIDLSEKCDQVDSLSILSRSQSIEKLCKNYSCDLVMINKLYKKNLFNNVRYPFGKIYEDEWVIHHILGNSIKTIDLPYKLYYYRINPNSIMRRKFSLDAFSEVGALLNRIDFCKNNGFEYLLDDLNLIYCNKMIEFYNKSKENRTKSYHLILPSLKQYRDSYRSVEKRKDVFDRKNILAYKLFGITPWLYKLYKSIINHINGTESISV